MVPANAARHNAGGPQCLKAGLGLPICGAGVCRPAPQLCSPPRMSDPLPPHAAPPVGATVASSWGPLAPGVWLMRHLAPGASAVLLLLLSGLPALPWLLPSAQPMALPQVWVPLLAVALYGWICAGLVWRLRGEPPAASAPAAALPALADGPIAMAAAVVCEPEAGLQPPAEAPQPSVDVPSGSDTAAVALEPADLRVGLAEIRGAVDEIARRVVGAGGLLDACGKAADEALAEIEALRDEERHAQKLLSAMRGRLLLLDRRCHALAHAAAPQQALADEPAAELQAALDQVLLCHQLAERLGAAERQHGARMDALCRSMERIGGHAERGLREAHQVMTLTRRVTSTLDAADQDLACAGGVGEPGS